MGKAKAAVRSVFPILDRKSAIDASADQGSHQPIAGHIELKNVKFVYPNRPSVVVFRWVGGC